MYIYIYIYFLYIYILFQLSSVHSHLLFKVTGFLKFFLVVHEQSKPKPARGLVGGGFFESRVFIEN